MKPKSLLQSKTAWGATILFIQAIYLTLFNQGDTPIDPAVSEYWGLTLSEAATSIFATIGWAFTLYGRIVASRPVTITGKP